MKYPASYGNDLRHHLLFLFMGFLLTLGSMLPALATGEDLIFGGPGTGDGKFSGYVRGLDTDASGNIYVLDGGTVSATGETAGGFRVQRFNSYGGYQMQFSVYDPMLGINNTPTRIAVSDSGEVFVLITQANQVRRYSKGALTATYAVTTAQPILYQDSDSQTSNAGGIYFRYVYGIPYLFVTQSNGATVRKINTSSGVGSNITLSRRIKSSTDLCVGFNGELYILGTDAVTNGQNLILCYNSAGVWQRSIGSGVFDRSASGFKTGDVARHCLEMDQQGNLYSVGPDNEAKIFKYALSEGTIYYRQGEFAFGDPYSIHGNDLYMATDRAGRVYCLTTHSDSGLSTRRASPAVVRLIPSYFTTSPTRQLSAIGLGVAFENNTPYNISYNLQPIPYEFVIKAATRPVHTLAVRYRAYDMNKNVVNAGTFTLNLQDTVEARKSMSFTPPKYGWYSITFELYDSVIDPRYYLQGNSIYFGVTADYAGMPKLAAGESPGGWNDVPRQAFSGLPLLRIASTMPAGEMQAIVDSAKKYGVRIFVQFESASDCTQTHVQEVVNRMKGQVQYYSVVNEPDLSMGAGTYVGVLRRTYQWIKTTDPDAKVMGPSTCGIKIGWLRTFYEYGAKDYCDILAIHDYEGNEAIDPEHWSWIFGELRNLMTEFGDGDKPIWQTERGIPGIRGGNFLGPTQAVRMTLHRDVLDSLGVSAMCDYYYYLNDGGFGDYPAYIWSGTGPHPAALALRTRFALTRGTLPLGQYDFGPTGNKLFFGLRYNVGGANIAMVRNLGTDSMDLTVTVTGGNTLTVVDAFGNEQDYPVTGGQVTLQVPMMPLYLKLASGQSVTMQPLRFGRNLATRAAYSYTKGSSGAFSALTNGILEPYHSTNPYLDTYWYGDFATSPQTLDITFAESQVINKLILFSARADNAYSSLLDFDLQYWDGSRWNQLGDSVQTHCPPSDNMNMYDHFAQTWYQDQNYHVLTFPTITAKKLRVVVYRTTLGFAPDKVANDAMMKAWGGQQAARLQLREIEIYGPPDFVPPAIPQGFTAIGGVKQIGLEWDNNIEADLLGYNLYRAQTPGGPYTKLNAAPLSVNRYMDTDLETDVKYYYVVRAVDKSENESDYSSEESAVAYFGIDTTDDRKGTITVGSDVTVMDKSCAFDNDPASSWWGYLPGGTNWIQYQYANDDRCIVTSYSLLSTKLDNLHDPVDWTLKGSNDGGQTWTLLDTRVGETFAASFITNYYRFSNTTPYNCYRLDFTKLRGGDTALEVNEIELFGVRFFTVKQPTITPESGNFMVETTVSINNPLEGTDIHYTIDGSNPTIKSPIYTKPLRLTSTTTVKACLAKDGWLISDTVGKTFTIFPKLETLRLASNPAGPFHAYSPITLNATSQGGQDVAFEYWLCDTRGVWTKRQPFLSNNILPWTPTLPGEYVWAVYARDLADPNTKLCYADQHITILPAPFTDIALSASPAIAVAAGAPMTLTATATGGTDLRYEFWLRDPVGQFTRVRNYSTNPIYAWTPTIPGNYQWVVYTYDAAYPALPTLHTILNYTVTDGALMDVTLNASPVTTALTGTAVTVTATAIGGVDPRYEFWLRNPYGISTKIQSFSSNASLPWQPTVSGYYQWTVNAYDANRPTLPPHTAVMTYSITRGLLSGVTLIPSPAKTMIIGTSCTLTAIPRGGETVLYEFWLKSPDGVVKKVQNYSTNAVMTWKPTVLGVYVWTVYVKENGWTVTEKISTSVNCTVIPAPLTKVTASASPATSAITGTPITVTGIASGGTAIQYEFWLSNMKGSWGCVKSYSAANKFIWQPTVTGTYRWTIFARDIANPTTPVQSTTMYYTVVNGPLSGVQLAASPANGATANTPVTVTAIAQGGVNVLYEFWLRDPLGQWERVQTYKPNASMKWTPTKAGSYQWAVYVREEGKPLNPSHCTSLDFKIR